MLETAVAMCFRFVLYAFFGLTMEMVFSVTGIERALGCEVKKRVPRAYLEGFVSLYMIPLHGLGLLLAFEPIQVLISDWFIGFRFLFWAVFISAAEVLWGWLLIKVRGFYPWDYYADSPYKMFDKGYTLWTLVPLWGFAGLALEVYSDLLLHLSPNAVSFFLGN